VFVMIQTLDRHRPHHQFVHRNHTDVWWSTRCFISYLYFFTFNIISQKRKEKQAKSQKGHSLHI